MRYHQVKVGVMEEAVEVVHHMMWLLFIYYSISFNSVSNDHTLLMRALFHHSVREQYLWIHLIDQELLPLV
jgi:hypothetical protein